MSKNCPIMTRMKSSYEIRSQTALLRRTPVIIRVDGKSFHQLTKGMDRPFDPRLTNCMQEASLILVRGIQGCKLAYVQSDEISLLLTDFDTLTTDAWFGYNVQKMVSVSASMATFGFNEAFKVYFGDTRFKLRMGFFDSRAFNLPPEEVNNYFLARQKDATKNSIASVAQCNFSHKELQGVSARDMQSKLLVEKDINWNDLETRYKRGFCWKRINGEWKLDLEIPVFNENLDYINNLLRFDSNG